MEDATVAACQNSCTIGINDASHLPRLGHYHRVPCCSVYATLHNHRWRELGEQRYKSNTHIHIYQASESQLETTTTEDVLRILLRRYDLKINSMYWHAVQYLSRNNDRREVDQVPHASRLYWHVVHASYGTNTVRKVNDVPTRAVSTDMRYLPSMVQSLQGR